MIHDLDVVEEYTHSLRVRIPHNLGLFLDSYRKYVCCSMCMYTVDGAWEIHCYKYLGLFSGKPCFGMITKWQRKQLLPVWNSYVSLILPKVCDVSELPQWRCTSQSLRNKWHSHVYITDLITLWGHPRNKCTAHWSCTRCQTCSLETVMQCI